MALWLELIPKIHRSDELDRHLHLLDDYDNDTTFEREGTRQLVLDEAVIDERYFTTTTTTSTSTSTTADLPMSSAFRRVVRRTSTSPRPLTTPTRLESGQLTKSGSLAVVELASANVPLSVTVAVGCTLLLLNVVVFIVVCRQNRRARLKLGAAARFRSRDELKHGGDTESAGFDSNHSSVSSYSLAASVQHGDYGRSRNVRFCEARGAPVVVTSQDGGSSVFATRRLPPRPGRDNETEECYDNELTTTTTTANHLNNPSTTV